MKHRSAPSSRVSRIAKWGIIPAALLVSGVIIAPASYSAFSDTTENPTSNWAAGSVNLVDDDSGTALFNATNLAPGATGSKCIVVTSTSTLPTTVKLYGTSPATTNALSDHINLTVEEGTGGSFSDCTGFSGSTIYNGTLAAFATTHSAFSNGAGSWAPPAGTESQSYKFTYTFSASAPNSTQGGSAELGFTWEAQS